MLAPDTAHLRLALFAACLSLVACLAAACTSGNDETATSTSTTAITPTATSSASMPTSTAAASPSPVSSPAATSTGGSGGMDCVALGNLGIPGIPLESQGSEQPTSQVAEQTGAYFESVFDAALGNATPTCYIEGTTDGNSGLWISYSVEGAIPANAADLIKNELVAKGIAEGNIRTLSTSIFGGQFSGVTVSGDPALGQYQESGVGLLITQQGIVLIAGVDVNAITP